MTVGNLLYAWLIAIAILESICFVGTVISDLIEGR